MFVFVQNDYSCGWLNTDHIIAIQVIDDDDRYATIKFIDNTYLDLQRCSQYNEFIRRLNFKKTIKGVTR